MVTSASAAREGLGSPQLSPLARQPAAGARKKRFLGLSASNEQAENSEITVLVSLFE